jgi:IclR family transcriptional regulator, acetate operon repressor
MEDKGRARYEETMGTIGKALTLLDILSGIKNDAGLTEIALACGYDKATTRRFLVELESHGFVEQLPETRKYRIGATPMRLARIREDRYPFLKTAAPFVRRLMEETGETVHLSEFSSGKLSTIHVAECDEAHRVFVDVGTVLPFHATASGLAFLAACPPEMIEAELAKPLEAHTGYTVVDAAEFRHRIRETQARGFSVNWQGMQAGVISASAAIGAPGRRPIGSITVAAPFVRTGEDKMLEHGAAARATADRISEAFFGADRNSAPQTQARRIGR